MPRKIKIFFLIITFVISLYLVVQFHKSTAEVSKISDQEEQIDSISSKARQVTVRLIGEYISGSGVIINSEKDNNNNNIYYVLTCAHVLDRNLPHKSFQVITFDGNSYEAETETQIKLNGFDLAIVKFTTKSAYDVAIINQKNFLDNNQTVYAAGFPNLKYEQGDWKNTFKQGVKHYQFNNGEIAIKLSRAMEGGYELGLTNEIEQGMSGGPLFNHQSELIGIVGRSKYGVGGINAYKFVDGSYPSKEMLAEMESLSWAIPLQSISKQLATKK
jgi:S1-C subfamily serine protease